MGTKITLCPAFFRSTSMTYPRFDPKIPRNFGLAGTIERRTVYFARCGAADSAQGLHISRLRRSARRRWATTGSTSTQMARHCSVNGCHWCLMHTPVTARSRIGATCALRHHPDVPGASATPPFRHTTTPPYGEHAEPDQPIGEHGASSRRPALHPFRTTNVLHPINLVWRTVTP